jgi:transient receptor potential cation channel subfamily C member 4
VIAFSGNVFAEVRSLWTDGLLDYISDLWNFVDLFSNTFYVTWMGLRFTAVFVTWVRGQTILKLNYCL